MGKSKVIVGMSGGVDSSVGAALLLEQGYDVQGLFMKNWEDDDENGECGAAEDLKDVKRVCGELEIPLHLANFAGEYRQRVFSQFLREYRAGRTPNPDILCNREIKFRAFLDRARGLGASAIATGHYARRRRMPDGSSRLLRGVDPGKDQSYFLHALNQEQLAQTLFPLGELHKSRVRELARELGLHNHARRDSTGICFIGERNFRQFLGRYLRAEPGPMVDPDGQTVGQHVGLCHYTIGQRQGLGIGGRSDGSGEPWYVADKDMPGNRLFVVQGGRHPALYHDCLEASDLHWVTEAPRSPMRLSARIRYRQPDQACELSLDRGRARVRFQEPQWAVAPGQSIVFYRDEECLGGGIIDSRWRSEHLARTG